MFTPVAQTLLFRFAYRSIMNTQAIKRKNNFNTKHLGKGDSLPPFNGKLRVYNMRYCPYAQRTILALNAKQIDYEVVNINLMDKPEWLFSKSPLGKVPSIELEDGICIYESLVSVEFIDEVYTQRPLLPKDPIKRAFDKIIVETASPIYNIFFKIIKNLAISHENIDAYHFGLEYLQEQLQKRGTKFLGGSEPGYADYMIWPWFERLLICQKVDKRIEIDLQKYKLLVAYLNNMGKDPAVTSYLMPSETFLEVFDKYREGKSPNYDLLLEA